MKPQDPRDFSLAKLVSSPDYTMARNASMVRLRREAMLKHFLPIHSLGSRRWLICDRDLMPCNSLCLFDLHSILNSLSFDVPSWLCSTSAHRSLVGTCQRLDSAQSSRIASKENPSPTSSPSTCGLALTLTFGYHQRRFVESLLVTDSSPPPHRSSGP
jgi:hypothetical protein